MYKLTFLTRLIMRRFYYTSFYCTKKGLCLIYIHYKTKLTQNVLHPKEIFHRITLLSGTREALSVPVLLFNAALGALDNAIEKQKKCY